MKPFETRPGAHPSPTHARVYGIYEKLYTLNDFCAALMFLVGSILFFYKSLETAAIWCFVIGSVNFMLRPTIKVLREFHLASLPMPGDDPRAERG
ncbi:cobyric acid synthase [Salinisphaera orenii MK-B5]|uniref:Cobyric acid synthase n=1 Tax=Salinisphaera orenii MK-B5 TaxID=856730 RepID=A0A423PIH2_9GAMM|nr:YrhK family protein [Salinisphaera orenii]ROO25355.1 cobyric acid synthase [Salinisphaera orenii MK-B5]